VELDTQERTEFTPANVLGNFIAEVFGTGAGPAPAAAPAPASTEPTTTLVPPAEIGAPLTTGSAGTAAAPPVGGWTVQVGAAPSEAGARLLLTQAGTNLAGLSDYRSLIQPIERDGQELYRARFVGFADRSQASAMCEALKRRSINCLAMPG
jgi:D-alanyl-D-alanine carboxypeptidase